MKPFLILAAIVGILFYPAARAAEWWAERYTDTGFVKVNAEQRGRQ